EPIEREVHLVGARSEEQPARRLWIEDHLDRGMGGGGGSDPDAAAPPRVLVVKRAADAAREERRHARQEWERAEIDHGGGFARPQHLAEMPGEAEAGDVGDRRGGDLTGDAG